MIGRGYRDRYLYEAEIRELLQAGLRDLSLADQRVLVIIPDSTRTAPVPLLFRLLHELLSGRVAALDYLVALGTHPVMSEAALNKLVGITAQERATTYAGVGIYDHRWDRAETFVQAGILPRAEVAEITQGMLAQDVPVALNRMVFECEQIIVCGPVFPHEVAGFSGGTKYFVPGIAGQEIIDFTHWLGALMTSRAIIGARSTPVRQLIDRAASFIETPATFCNLVVTHAGLAGMYIGSYAEAWPRAVELSAQLHVRYVEEPFRRVLSIMPEMYDDIWTAAKGMYKLEPVIADGGEVVIYAPHIDEISYTFGELLDEIGYHVRDYFVEQWERFREYPWGVLAHSTHLRGVGEYDAETGVERPRIQVTLATGISPERCRQVNLGYLDPATVDVGAWEGRESAGILVVPCAGERLYRLKKRGSATLLGDADLRR